MGKKAIGCWLLAVGWRKVGKVGKVGRWEGGKGKKGFVFTCGYLVNKDRKLGIGCR